MIDWSMGRPTLKLDPPNDGWTWVAYTHILKLAMNSEHDWEAAALYEQLAHAIIDEDRNPRAGRP